MSNYVRNFDAKNYYNQTTIHQLIANNMSGCFFLKHDVYSEPRILPKCQCLRFNFLCALTSRVFAHLRCANEMYVISSLLFPAGRHWTFVCYRALCCHPILCIKNATSFEPGL